MINDTIKITILGATGRTGRELIMQASQRQFQVTALVRNAHGFDPSGVTMLEGDITDALTVKQAIAGSAAVISVLAFTPKLFGKKETTLYSTTANTLTKCIQGQGRPKLIFCTSAGVINDPQEMWFYRHLLKPFLLQPGYADMAKAERIIAGSGVDWIIVRPSRLKDGPLTDQFRVSQRFRPAGGTSVSRADVASFILDQVTSREWIGKTPTIAD